MSSNKILVLLSIVTSMTANTAFALEQQAKTDTKSFVLKLGATRLIYDPASSGTTLAVSNPHDYPILLRSEVLNEDGKSPAPFIVTPPLLRLDNLEKTRVRVLRTNDQLINDRESLYWLCVTGIPPKTNDVWANAELKDSKSKAHQGVATVNVNLSVKTCIKLFFRPSQLGQPLDMTSKLTWVRNGNNLNVNNPTPFYINLKSVKIDGKSVGKLTYIPPFSSKSFLMPTGATKEVQWQIITDIGGDSKIFTSPLS